MSRNYTNSLLFESCLDNLSEASEVKKLAKRIFQPFVEVVEEDCGTKLGTKISVSHEQRGEVDSATLHPLTIGEITDYMSAGQYLLRARRISSCISDGGICRVCALGTYQDTANYPIPAVGSLLQLKLDFPLSVQVVPGLVSASSVTLDFSAETFDRLVVFTENTVLPYSSYSIVGNSLTFGTPVSGILIIKFIVNTLSPIIKEGYSSYFGSLLGAKPVSLVDLVGREDLYPLSRYEPEVDSLVEDLILAKVPGEITSYLNSDIPKLERTAAALICAAIFGVHEGSPQPPSWEYLAPDVQTVGSNLVVTRAVPPNSTVQLLLNGVVILTTTADPSGSWTYSGSPLPGEYLIYYVSTPPGSMTGHASPVVLYDFSPGAITLSAPRAFGSSSEITEGGTSETWTSVSNSSVDPVGYTVYLYVNNSLFTTTTVNSSGDWNVAIGTGLPDGAYSVKYKVSPSAGSPLSGFSPPKSFSIATIVLTATYFTSVVYPYSYREDLSVPQPTYTYAALWGLGVDDMSVSVPVIGAGSLTVQSAFPTYNIPVETTTITTPSIVGGSLVVTVNYVNYTNGLIEDLLVTPMPAIQSGSLVVTINYVNYNNWLLEDIAVPTPTIQSGTLA